MKTTKITLLLLCIWSFNGYSQDGKTNSLTLNWGVGNLHRQDINFSPFIHKSWSALNVGLTYEHTGKQYHRVYSRFGRYTAFHKDEFTYLPFREEGSISTLPHIFMILDLNYTLGFDVISNKKLSLLVGGQVRNLLNIGDYEYADSGIGFYNFAFGIDVWTGLDFAITNKHSLGAELSLPLFSWVTRSPYLGQDDQYFRDVAKNKVFDSIGNYIRRGELQSWGGFQRVDFQMKYAYALSEKWNLKATYSLGMNFSKSPQSYSSIENVLMIGAQINL